MSFALKSPDPLGSDNLLVGLFPQRISRVDLYKWDIFYFFFTAEKKLSRPNSGYTIVCGRMVEY